MKNLRMDGYASDECIFWVALNSIIGILILYYSLLAIYAIVSTPHVNIDNECNNSLLFIFVSLTIVVTLGLYISLIHYSVKPTNIRFAKSIFFTLGVLGIYCLLFIEMCDKCSFDNHYRNYNNDLFSIAWAWIYMVSCSIFALFILTFVYIIVDVETEENNDDEMMSEMHML